MLVRHVCLIFSKEGVQRRAQQARNGCPCGRPIRTGMTDNVARITFEVGVCGTSRLKPTEHQETLSMDQPDEARSL